MLVLLISSLVGLAGEYFGFSLVQCLLAFSLSSAIGFGVVYRDCLWSISRISFILGGINNTLHWPITEELLARSYCQRSIIFLLLTISVCSSLAVAIVLNPELWGMGVLFLLVICWLAKRLNSHASYIRGLTFNYPTP